MPEHFPVGAFLHHAECLVRKHGRAPCTVYRRDCPVPVQHVSHAISAQQQRPPEFRALRNISRHLLVYRGSAVEFPGAAELLGAAVKVAALAFGEPRDGLLHSAESAYVKRTFAYLFKLSTAAPANKFSHNPSLSQSPQRMRMQGRTKFVSLYFTSL